MYWIKKSLLVSFIFIIFNGCYGGVGYTIAKHTGLVANPDEGKVYLEKFDNDIFLEYILNKNYINGLRKEDVIYVDNVLAGVNSSKLIFTKNYLYEIFSGLNYKNIKNYELNKSISITKEVYITQNTFLITKDKGDRLYVYRVKKNTKWYEKTKKMYLVISSRYNNIKKIKQVIDERVAFHKKHKTYEKGYKSADNFSSAFETKFQWFYKQPPSPKYKEE